MSQRIQPASGLARPGPGPWLGVLTVVVPSVAGLIFLTALGLGTSSGSLTGYTSGSRAALVLGAVSGAGLVFVGIAGFLRTAESMTVALATSLGTAWLAAEVAGWDGGPALIRTAATAISPFLVPLLVHLGLAYPGNRIRRRSESRFVTVVYGLAAGVAVGRLLVDDPFFDLNCWRTCAHNPLVPFPNQVLASDLGTIWLASEVVAGLGAGALLLRHVVTQMGIGRGWAWYVLGPVGASLGAVAVRAAVELTNGFENPGSSVFRALFLVQSAALLGVGLGVTWGFVRVWKATRGLETLGRDLEEAQTSGGLRRILANSLGDESLTVAYGFGSAGFVDATGEPVLVAAAEGQAVTSIERAGEALGVVIHRSTLAIPDLKREIGAAARLAIDNERLRAGILARVAQLRSAQRELVRTSDAIRNQIERNLHDGAQQRLLAVSFELRLAVAAAKQSGDPVAPELEAALDSILRCLGDVRELAHGIFPSILKDAGLGPALVGLAETAPQPVEVHGFDERFSAEIEMAAYVLAVEVLEQARRIGAGLVTLSSTVRDKELMIEAALDRSGLRAGDLKRAGDRVGAAGGELHVMDDRLTAVIPCGS